MGLLATLSTIPIPPPTSRLDQATVLPYLLHLVKAPRSLVRPLMSPSLHPFPHIPPLPLRSPPNGSSNPPTCPDSVHPLLHPLMALPSAHPCHIHQHLQIYPNFTLLLVTLLYMDHHTSIPIFEPPRALRITRDLMALAERVPTLSPRGAAWLGPTLRPLVGCQ